MASGDNTLGKAERLSGKKSVATLLAGGRWGSLGHFRYCWMFRTDGVSAGNLPGRILVSVPKRCFKRAVKRNLLKRRIREAYRVQKLPGADIMFQYNSAELADFGQILPPSAQISPPSYPAYRQLWPPSPPRAEKRPKTCPDRPKPPPRAGKRPKTCPDNEAAEENT